MVVVVNAVEDASCMENVTKYKANGRCRGGQGEWNKVNGIHC